jgi:hypothetical protein
MSTPPVPQTGAAVAKAVRDAVGGHPAVQRYYDEAEANWVDIMRWPDRPTLEMVTYSTLSLHLAPNVLEREDIRVEIAGVAPKSASRFENLLSTAAFFVMKDHWLCAPGVVFPDLIPRYCPELSSTLQHLLFMEPFPWSHLSSVDVGADLQVHWLFAMPISEAERVFLLKNGYNKLEALFESADVQYMDLARESMV